MRNRYGDPPRTAWPADATPDDTSRAYRRFPWHRQRDNTPPTVEGPKTEPPGEKDTTDRLHPHIDHPAFQDRFDDREPPDRYGIPLELPDGTRVPCLNGRPDRNQTEQGWLGGCGVIATLGAVAAHRPDNIASRITERPDGTYNVSLNAARWTDSGAESTGELIEMTVTPDLPVFGANPNLSAFASTERAAWPAILEKAVAGLDQTWTQERRDDWSSMWKTLCETDASDPKLKNPRVGQPPDGYTRLNQGSTSWERAELLTQLTGKESIVRPYPDDPKQLSAELGNQLKNGKPVLVASRPKKHEHEDLPHELEPSHAYEVVAVTDGRIYLRNPYNWGDPDAISTIDFTANMQPDYTTLK